MNRATRKIDPERWYSLQEIVLEGLFEWCGSMWSARRALNMDRRNRNLLKAVIVGEGRSKRYRIKGQNIIHFKNVWESGDYQM